MPPAAPGPREIPSHGQEDGQTAPGGAGPQTCFMGMQGYSRASSRQSPQSSAPFFAPFNERTPRRGQWGKPPEVAALQGCGIGVQVGPWRGANVHGRPMASTVQSPIQAPREQFCLLVHQSPRSRVWGQGQGDPLGKKKACGQKEGPLEAARCPRGTAVCLLLPLCFLHSFPGTQLALLFCLIHFFIYMFAFPLHIWFPSAQDGS